MFWRKFGPRREDRIRAAVACAALEPRTFLSAAAPIGNLNTTTDMLAPARFVQVGGRAFFGGRGIDGSGAELWQTDGTRAGTVLVKDIMPGLIGSNPTNFTAIDQTTCLFSARDALAGTELWKTDGTAAGTVLVKDINPGTSDANPGNLVAINGIVYFTATEPTGGTELWRSDGTADGTYRLKDIYAGSSSSSPTYLTPYNGLLLFSADDGIKGRELWRSDGTPEGTVRVADLNTGFSGSSPRYLVPFAGEIYLAADPASSGLGSTGDLYRTDGSTLERVKRIDFLTSGTDYSTLLNLTPSGNMLYFLAGSSINATYELWRSDGTDAGTFRLLTGSSITRTMPMVAGGDHSLVFPYTSSISAKEMWSSDGTLAGTSILADIIPGIGNGVVNLAMGAVGTTVYFAPNRLDGVTELYKTDGTPGGTMLVANVDGPPGFLSSFAAFNQELLFSGLYYADQGDLYVSDGTWFGTQRIGATASGDASSMMDYPSSNYSRPAFAGAPGGPLYFSATNGFNGYELWSVNGDGTGVGMVADLSPGGQSSDPGEFTAAADGSVYFTASTPSTGRELYRIPPGGGTPQIIEVLPGPDSSDVRGLYAAGAGGIIYFNSRTTTTGQIELHRYDPDTGIITRPIYTGSSQALTSATGFVHLGAYWYFSAATPTTGNELWRTTGAAGSLELFANISSGSGNSYPSLLTPSGDGKLYFTASDGSTGTELWMTNGTTTSRVIDISPGSTSTEIDHIAAINGVVYFNALPGTSGGVDRLWKYDPAGGAGAQAMPFNLDAPRQLVVIDGRLYFIATDDKGRGVFRYDPAAASGSAPARLTPVTTGGGLTFTPIVLYPAGTHVYAFVIAGTGKGDHYELWELGATPAMTVKIQDLQPVVPVGTAPVMSSYWVFGRYSFGASPTHLFFPAWTPQSGFEPYALPLVDATAPTVTASAFQPATSGRSVQFQFSEDVHNSLSPSSVAITLAGSQTAIYPTSVNYDLTSNTATFTLPAALANGDYRATIGPGTADAAGNSLSDTALDFFVLAGDVNQDRTVDFGDLVVLAQNYGGSNKAYAQGDLTGDGKVDFVDLVLLAQNYGSSLAAAVASPAPLAAPASAAIMRPPSATKNLFSLQPVKRASAKLAKPAARRR